MIQELLAEIDNWRAEYMHLGRELGEIINDQQDIILKLQNENRRIKRENWNLKKTKGRRKRTNTKTNYITSCSTHWRNAKRGANDCTEL